MKNITRFFLATIFLLSTFCIYEGNNPSSYDKLFDREYDYAKGFLYAYFYDQIMLPDSSLHFVSIDSLYKSTNDSQTIYMNPHNANVFKINQSTQIAVKDLGIIIDIVYNGAVIAYLYPNAPGFSNNLHVGDTITIINKDTLKGKDTSFINYVLSEKNGGNKELHIKRNTITFIDTLECTQYFIPTVFTTSIGDSLFYISISAFIDSTEVSEGTATQLEAAIQVAESLNVNTIIDLRNNYGGSFLEGVKSASKFLCTYKKNIIATRERIIGDSNTTTIADILWEYDGKDSIEIANTYHILFNNNTAGAAEIIISCLKDNYPNQIELYGSSNTHGLGEKQILTHTPDSAIIKITSGELFPTQSVSYNKKGISPDNPFNTIDDLINIIFPGQTNNYKDILETIKRLRRKHVSRNTRPLNYYYRF